MVNSLLTISPIPRQRALIISKLIERENLPVLHMGDVRAPMYSTQARTGEANREKSCISPGGS